MNEEMMTLVEVENENTEAIVNYDEPEKNGGGILGKLIVGAAVVGVGAFALIRKNRDKIEQRRIRNLEKKGYVITKPEEVVVELHEVKSEDCENAEN